MIVEFKMLNISIQIQHYDGSDELAELLLFHLKVIGGFSMYGGGGVEI